MDDGSSGCFFLQVIQSWRLRWKFITSLDWRVVLLVIRLVSISHSEVISLKNWIDSLWKWYFSTWLSVANGPLNLENRFMQYQPTWRTCRPFYNSFSWFCQWFKRIQPKCHDFMSFWAKIGFILIFDFCTARTIKTTRTVGLALTVS